MWPQLVIALIVLIISTAISYSMRPKPQDQEPSKLDIPEPDEGGVVPVVFGTVTIKNSNIIWHGDPSTIPIKGSGGK